MKHSLTSGALLLLAACGSQTPLTRLADQDGAVAAEAIQHFADRGEDALPELRAALAAAEDPRHRRRIRTALGRITGQWGSDGGILWKRSLAEATGGDRPILLLQLFGRFDEEFC